MKTNPDLMQVLLVIKEVVCLLPVGRLLISDVRHQDFRKTWRRCIVHGESSETQQVYIDNVKQHYPW